MGKWENAVFHPQILDFGQNESYFRDFHQILGKTVVFKVKFEKFGRLQKWGNGKTPFSPLIIGFRSGRITFS
jgi:hypothetical protein